MQNGINNSINMGQQLHVQSAMGPEGRTTSVDHNMNGTINLNAWHNRVDGVNPGDTENEQGTGHLGGNISGLLRSAGAENAEGGTESEPPTGNLTLNLNGNTSNTVTFVIDTLLDPTAEAPSVGFEPIAQVNPMFAMSMLDPGPLATSARVTVTHTVEVPTYVLAEADSQTEEGWSLNSLNYQHVEIETTRIVGDYVNNLLYPGGTGHGERTERTTTSTRQYLDDFGELRGEETIEHTVVAGANAAISTPFYSGTVTASVNLTERHEIWGSELPGQPATDVLYEEQRDYGTSFYQHELTIPGGGVDDFTVLDERDYRQNDRYWHGDRTLLDVNGTDRRTIHKHTFGITPEAQIEFWRTDVQEAARSPGPNNQVRTVETNNWWWHRIETPLGGGTPVETWGQNPQPGFLDGLFDAFWNAFYFANGVADSLTCGLTARARNALGFGSLVDTESGWYTAGEVTGMVAGLAIPGPCGKATLMRYAINGLRATQGAGSAINAAEAAQNGDALGVLLNGAGAKFAFGKFNACFAAGTPLYETWTTSKLIEEFHVGDTVLSRDENDPNGIAELKKVEEVFVAEAKILHLHVGREVIRTTAEHPFWAEGKGWTDAAKLQPGDRLVGRDSQTMFVREVYDTGETETVYNLRIADYHTYFVGDAERGWSAWAHNACTKRGGRLTEPTLPQGNILNQNGVRVRHYYRSGDHGPAHLHVSGGGPTTRIGANGHPLSGDPALGATQKAVIQENIPKIRAAVDKIKRWIWFNNLPE